ncbi:676_t:CDS:2 [Cetraspora pellucida]|uniref:676_t:CDS:1 n=1 Tax=Cetraspora pellucida TaxID=1433469 RepID=A0A9N9EWW0_9GLOM|nr:676_t:CDS:2 [Cetraspora pellucida]
MDIIIYPNPIPQELAKIITKAWNHEPSQRPKVMEMLSDVKNLYDHYAPKGTSPKVCPKGNSDDIPGFDLTSAINNNQRSNNNNRESTYLPEDCETLTLDNITTIPKNTKIYRNI